MRRAAKNERNAQRAQAWITPAQSGAERSGRVPRESPSPARRRREAKEVEEERARAVVTEAGSVKGAPVPSRSGAPDRHRPPSRAGVFAGGQDAWARRQAGRQRSLALQWPPRSRRSTASRSQRRNARLLSQAPIAIAVPAGALEAGRHA